MPKRIEREPMIVQVEFYKKRIGVLEAENERLRAELDEYVREIHSLEVKKDAEQWRNIEKIAAEYPDMTLKSAMSVAIDAARGEDV